MKSALSQVASSKELGVSTNADTRLTDDYDQWLNVKLQESREWLAQADGDNVSIQVFVRKKSAAKDLVIYLLNSWPLDISKTFLYEVSTNDQNVYRVFYSEFNTLSKGRDQIDILPESVKVNSPYLRSVYRMQKALL